MNSKRYKELADKYKGKTFKISKLESDEKYKNLLRKIGKAEYQSRNLKKSAETMKKRRSSKLPFLIGLVTAVAVSQFTNISVFPQEIINSASNILAGGLAGGALFTTLDKITNPQKISKNYTKTAKKLEEKQVKLQTKLNKVMENHFSPEEVEFLNLSRSLNRSQVEDVWEEINKEDKNFGENKKRVFKDDDRDRKSAEDLER